MIDVYIETGQKFSFASALDWPGWSRRGAGEASALQALFDYAPRYALVLRSAGISFDSPGSVSEFVVVERLPGGSGTDFGAPGVAASSDAQPVDDAKLQRLLSILAACWQALDKAAEAARGKQLRKGPRGGGRDLNAIARHVLEADAAYLGQLGWKFHPDGSASAREELVRIRQAILEGMTASARGELPTHGPRGGARWTTRYFARRSAWHVLDHAWEIEDRTEASG